MKFLIINILFISSFTSALSQKITVPTIPELTEFLPTRFIVVKDIGIKKFYLSKYDKQKLGSKHLKIRYMLSGNENYIKKNEEYIKSNGKLIEDNNKKIEENKKHLNDPRNAAIAKKNIKTLEKNNEQIEAKNKKNRENIDVAKKNIQDIDRTNESINKKITTTDIALARFKADGFRFKQSDTANFMDYGLERIVFTYQQSIRMRSDVVAYYGKEVLQTP